ncbi:DNA segregation ATPase, FtsK/SpoIIIE family [Thermanaerovibrio velox DSM 12556]|uniref:DNA segregation ATPase, FtsK/SpoIIIE family n=1 Tax=Thermanaerovibrio velox DSM 12556 TaxID=926567 RepID=H0URU6_9BACT|nr:DNA translocase FtsK [Thermanaerovibrio velox]EHM10035.1 DNA segregation ATPase, FtsK/SpoIIIE family [Thermanaerovibrio velox DSM 12556]
MRNSRTYSARKEGWLKSLITLIKLDDWVWDWLAILSFLLSLFLGASLFTAWTGDLGRAVRNWMIDHVGISIIVPILFMAYASWARLFRYQVPNIRGQALGALSLTISLALMLAMWSEAFGHKRLLELSGFLGRSIGLRAFHLLGPFGATLLGLLCCLITVGAFSGESPSEVMNFIAMILANATAWSKDRFRALNILLRITTPTKSNKEQGLTGSDDFKNSAAPLCSEEEGYETAGDYMGGRSIESDNPFLLEEGTLEDVQADNLSNDEVDPSLSAEPIKPGLFPPPLDIIGPPNHRDDDLDQEQMDVMADRILSSLRDFGVEAELGETQIGPTVIQFRIQLAPGIKVSKVASLANDLALALAVPSLRIEAPIPGKPYVGVEIPNPERRSVSLREVMESEAFSRPRGDLPLPLGVSIDGSPMVSFLEDLPHLLVAGTTGSGKSVFINSCIVGLCSSKPPSDLRLILIDPKRVEMAIYDRLPHILTKPVVDSKKAVQALAWCIREMENRYDTFSRFKVRNLLAYNKKVLPAERLPQVVVVVDELADLMMTAPREVEDYICRLAQMARATGIHLILATQRPSVNVITGLIKANVPARVAFSLPSQADSRTILDSAGAEKLLGKGDMLFLSSRFPKPIRLQAPWIDEIYISRWLDHLVSTFGEPQVIDIEDQENGNSSGDASLDDPLLEEAIRIVLSSGVASASSLQRRLRVGFTRGARLIDTMEQLGIVGPPDGARPREILVDEDSAMEILREARGD